MQGPSNEDELRRLLGKVYGKSSSIRPLKSSKIAKFDYPALVLLRKSRFTSFKCSFLKRLKLLSEEYIPPDEKHEKHEPNIMIKCGDFIICDIEVTGSDIEMMPPNDIFILRGKYVTAQKRKEEKGIDTWFYTVYLNSEYVLDLGLIEKFDANKAHEKYLKGVPELYIQVPCAEAYSRERLFEWIRKRLKQIATKQILTNHF